jgi:hypothetical protein
VFRGSIEYSVRGSGNWKDGGEAYPADASLQCFLEVAYRGLTGGISGVTHVQRQQDLISAREVSRNTCS